MAMEVTERVDLMEWKPIYPNNMLPNGIDGYYCLVLCQNKNGTYSGRKYSIVFQHEERESGTGFINKEKVDRYVLFEKIYTEIIGPLEYPEPTDEAPELFKECINTLNAYDVNDYGGFVYAYETIEMAKKRAQVQWDHIYGYVASFLKE